VLLVELVELLELTLLAELDELLGPSLLEELELLELESSSGRSD